MDVKVAPVVPTQRTTAAVLLSTISLAPTLKIAVPRMVSADKMPSTAASAVKVVHARQSDPLHHNVLLTVSAFEMVVLLKLLLTSGQGQIRSSPASASLDKTQRGKRFLMHRAILLRLRASVLALVRELKEPFKISMARVSHTVARMRTVQHKEQMRPARASTTAARRAVPLRIALLRITSQIPKALNALYT